MKIFITAFIAGLLGALLVSFVVRNAEPTQEELIKDFYSVETAVMVSPHGLRKDIMKGKGDEFILVDLRSEEEYEEGHIVGAVNVPAYKDKDHSDYGAINRIVSSFEKLGTDKDIIVYCYSIPCMTGRKVGKILADHGIYVKELGVGWNEWRYHWELWNHEHEWSNTDVLDYVTFGSEPGVFSGEEVIEFESCGASEELDC